MSYGLALLVEPISSPELPYMTYSEPLTRESQIELIVHRIVEVLPKAARLLEDLAPEHAGAVGVVAVSGPQVGGEVERDFTAAPQQLTRLVDENAV